LFAYYYKKNTWETKNTFSKKRGSLHQKSEAPYACFKKQPSTDEGETIFFSAISRIPHGATLSSPRIPDDKIFCHAHLGAGKKEEEKLNPKSQVHSRSELTLFLGVIMKENPSNYVKLYT
jgi:hypothetical protein